MNTKKTHAAMIALCSLHVLQGVFDETQGTDLFTHKRKQLINSLLKEVDHYFSAMFTDEDVQIQFFNGANAIELTSKWLIDNTGDEKESTDKLAEKIGRLYQLIGYEVEKVE